MEIFKAYLWVLAFPAGVENQYYLGWVFHPYSVKKWLVKGFEDGLIKVAMWEGEIPVLTRKGLEMACRELGENFYQKIRSKGMTEIWLESPGEDETDLYYEEGKVLVRDPELNIRRIILTEFMNYYYEGIDDLFDILVELEKNKVSSITFRQWLNLFNAVYEHIRDGTPIDRRQVIGDQDVSEFFKYIGETIVIKTLENSLKSGGIIYVWHNGLKVVRNPFKLYGFKLKGALDIFNNIEEWCAGDTLTGRIIGEKDLKELGEACLKEGWKGLDKTIRKWHHEGEKRFKNISLDELLKKVD